MILYAQEIKDELSEKMKLQVSGLKSKPGLVIISVGEDSASKIYVKNKIMFSENIGLKCTHIKLDHNVTQEKLLDEIIYYNADNDCDGLIVQLPLPKHIDEEVIINSVDASKDVDGFSNESIASLYLNEDKGFVPCTVLGVVDILEFYNIEISSQNIVVIGRSNIVGKPLSLYLQHKNATVTVCHSRTKNLKNHIINSDIVISAVGSPKFLDKSYFEDCSNITVIDVGINRDENGKICGDVDFEEVKNLVKNITPVPKGVGVMTVVNVCKNTIKSYLNKE